MVTLYVLLISYHLVEGMDDSKCTQKFDLSSCYSTEPKIYPKRTCHSSDVCKKKFNISYVKMDPYTHDLVADLLKTCCGNCTTTNLLKTYDNVSEIPEPKDTSSHFIFPVLGRSASRKLYGYHFLPVIEAPSVYYITARRRSILNHIVMECLNIWPLMVNFALLIGLSGFIGWLLEKRQNKNEFPANFFLGWFEGIWWSFVSMTTVGYGDKVPVSLFGRLFAMVWILVGITLFSFVTALLSMELHKGNSNPPPVLDGAKIGALRHRLYDAMFVASSGGVLIDIGGNSTEGLHEMITRLREKKIDGFILDRFSLFLLHTDFFATWPHDVEFIKTGTRHTELHHYGEPMSYGALVTDIRDYNFLFDFVYDNTKVLTTCNNLVVNYLTKLENGKKKKKADDDLLFSEQGDTFWTIFITSSSCILLIACVGLIYEYMKWKRKKVNSESIPLSAGHVKDF